MWYGKNADDHPRIRRDKMELLSRAQEKMEVGFQELIEILKLHFFQRRFFFAIALF
jgi:hypothetical protein